MTPTADSQRESSEVQEPETRALVRIEQTRPARNIITVARQSAGPLVARTLRAALPVIGQAARVAAPAVLAILANEALHRLQSDPGSRAVLHTEEDLPGSCPAGPSNVVIVQIVMQSAIYLVPAPRRAPGRDIELYRG